MTAAPGPSRDLVCLNTYCFSHRCIGRFQLTTTSTRDRGTW